MSDNHVAHAFTVHGAVQGVGFRYFTRNSARALCVTGWVANHSDGTVIGAVRGEPAAVSHFLRAIGAGPAGARVLRVDLEVAEAGGVSGEGFVIR